MRRSDYLDSRPGFVYLLQQGKNGPIKVGWTRSMFNRRQMLQAGNPYPLHVLRVVPGTRRDEGKIHSVLGKELRMRGDWYSKRGMSKAIRWIERLEERGTLSNPRTSGTQQTVSSGAETLAVLPARCCGCREVSDARPLGVTPEGWGRLGGPYRRGGYLCPACAYEINRDGGLND